MMTIAIVLLVVAIGVGIANLIVSLRRRSSGGRAVEDTAEIIESISRNVDGISRENFGAVKREIEGMTQLLQTSYATTASANTQNWKMLIDGINTNFAGMSREQQKNLGGMVDTLSNLVKTEQANAEKLERHLVDFIERLDARLHRMNSELAKSLVDVRDMNASQLKELRESNAKSLDEMRATVDEKLTKTLNDRLEQSFNTISERLESVHKGLGEMKVLSESVGSLNRVLNNAKVRGNWGEVALDSLLEQILAPEQYERQYRIEAKREAVDFAIRMPGRTKGENLYLPIDSKFPYEDYERMVNAADIGDRAGVDMYSKALEARIKKEAKSISEKYVLPPLTTNFAIMYLPIEGLFAEVVKRPGLCAELQNTYKVVVCGPTTIAALLNSLQLGFKTLAVQEKSLEVWKALAVFKKEFTKFADSIDKTQKKIDEASTSLTDATKRTTKIRKKLDFIENDTPDSLIDETIGKGADNDEG